MGLQEENSNISYTSDSKKIVWIILSVIKQETSKAVFLLDKSKSTA